MTPQQFSNYLADYNWFSPKGSEEHYQVCVLKHKSKEHMDVYEAWRNHYLVGAPCPIPVFDPDERLHFGDRMFQQAIEASRPLPEQFVPDY